MRYQSVMDVLKIFVVFLTLVATVHLKTVRQSDAIAELEAYIEAKRPEINPRYRLHYHVAPPVGWMNDPNGFSYYKGEYHLFYQFYPYDSQWGPMHWGHVVSQNLVDWKQLPTALVPEEEMCFSGSAIVKDDTLFLLYTGHILLSEDETSYNETQYLAFSDDGVVFHKYEGNPVMPYAPNGSPDFRDPKVWKHGDHYYVVLGSKTEDPEVERGIVLLYRSSDLISWEFLSVLEVPNTDLGDMWECPDFFKLKGKHILLISPMGMAQKGDRYINAHQTGYIIGSFNYETFEFIPEIGFQELDYGHEFYAATTIEQDGRRVLIAWFEGRDEDVDGWSGAMTIFRELDLVGHRIIMKPVETLTSLREERVWDGELAENVAIHLEKTGELLVSGDLSRIIELEIKGSNGGGLVSLRWDPQVRKVVVDKEGDVRQVEWLPLDSEVWRIFLDASSLELFCGEGEVVFSTRVYPDGDWQVTNLSPQALKAVAYKLRRSVPE